MLKAVEHVHIEKKLLKLLGDQCLKYFYI